MDTHTHTHSGQMKRKLDNGQKTINEWITEEKESKKGNRK